MTRVNDEGGGGGVDGGWVNKNNNSKNALIKPTSYKLV